MKRFFILTISFFLTITSFSQIDSASIYSNRKHSLGLNAGATTGLVFSYRYMPKRLGVQIALLPTGGKNNFWGDAGITLLYNIYSSPRNKVHLFNYLGNSIIYETDSYGNDLIWNTGIGYGIDIRGHDRISFGFMIGWGAYDITDDYAFYPDGTTYLFYRF